MTYSPPLAPSGSVLGNIPVVDMRDWVDGDERVRAHFIQVVGDALREYGFLRLRGHSVMPSLIEPAYAAARAFFSLSEDDKSDYFVAGGGGERGYTPFGSEHAKDMPTPDLKEFWHTGRELSSLHPLHTVYPPNLWPVEVPEFKARMLDLYNALEAVAMDMLEVIARYLGEAPDSLSSIARDGNSILRALHYPPLHNVSVVEGAVRAAAHEDINLITLLITSSHSGLEILRRDGEWMAVNAEPGEILMDSGDMLGRVTNRVLDATTHRVVNPSEDRSERFSMPFFVHPRPEAILRVFDSCRGSDFPEPEPDITGYAFLRERLVEIGLA
ncbi:MAG TPA: isopenicillin N synthase family oxygenase [Deltaproteobacteria bacterium]|nr:isopenicillin N synthase family oxygenase [Deltaproteobacteria bacterium]